MTDISNFVLNNESKKVPVGKFKESALEIETLREIVNNRSPGKEKEFNLYVSNILDKCKGNFDEAVKDIRNYVAGLYEEDIKKHREIYHEMNIYNWLL